MLDTSDFERAIERLKTSMDKAREARNAGDNEVYDLCRTAAIKSFEFTYELSLKMMKRALKASDLGADAVEKMLFRPLMRAAAEKGAVKDPMVWEKYRENRNRTAHGYHEEIAEEIFTKLPAFYESAEQLLTYLKSVAKDVY